jgi:hypothetical protein
VYVRFNRWSKQGVWQKVFEQLAKKPNNNEYALIDSTVVGVFGRTAAPLVRVKKGGTGQRLQEAPVPGAQHRGTEQQDSRAL